MRMSLNARVNLSEALSYTERALVPEQGSQECELGCESVGAACASW